MARKRPKPLRWVALLALIGLVGSVTLSRLNAPVARAERPVEVTIPRGASAARVGWILQRRGLVRNALAFRLAARTGGDWSVKAGTYTLSPSMSTPEILKRLQEGAPEETYRLTFPEGFTLEQVAERAARLPHVDAAEFQRLASMRGNAFTPGFSAPDNLEGYLFPDTYDFSARATTQDVIERMLRNFDEKVVQGLEPDLRAAARQGYDLHAIVTLASLVEREAQVKDEQPMVAAVLYNRLRIGMPLQVDATVQYVIGHRERLLYKDLEVDSPYNTYKVTGLPPGPIANPGIGAIRAALHPARVDYLYYTANPDGTHTFTTTLDAHNRATEKAREARNAGG